MESSINERIKQICDYYFGGNTSAMSRAIDVKQSTIRDIIGIKQSKPSFDTLKKIVDCPTIKVNPSWLLKGDGNVFDKSTGYFYFDFEKEDPFIGHIKESQKNISEMGLTVHARPRIPLTAAAGALTEAAEGVTIRDCEQLPVIHQLPSYDFTILLKGDSLYPKYESGDEVACKKIDRTSFIQWGKLHVLDTSQGIIAKRVYEDGDKIRCVSYNPEYPDFSIDKKEIYSISLVVGVLRI